MLIGYGFPALDLLNGQTFVPFGMFYCVWVSSFWPDCCRLWTFRSNHSTRSHPCRPSTSSCCSTTHPDCSDDVRYRYCCHDCDRRCRSSRHYSVGYCCSDDADSSSKTMQNRCCDGCCSGWTIHHPATIGCWSSAMIGRPFGLVLCKWGQFDA